MSLKKEQYDRIMAEYAAIRDRHRRELESRRAQAYARIPELQQLDSRTPSLAMRLLRKRLEGSDPHAAAPAAGTQPGDAARSAGGQDPGQGHGAFPEAGGQDPGQGRGALPEAGGMDPGQERGANREAGGQDPGQERGVPVTASFRGTAAQILRKKQQLLTSHGFPPDFLEMTWDCPDCRDTGYIGREKCHCLRRRETAVLYDQSHLETLLDGASFSALSEVYYTGEDLENFRRARRICQRFVEEFDTVCRSLYLYGTVGTGKTMLSVCAAAALIEKGKSVLYFSAASLFDRLADSTFSSDTRDELRSFTADLYGCDLLIIDDLGTEFTNAFVASQLFTCISERGLNRHPTIISTNLSLRELQTRYSDRVFSRITSTYEICKLSGRDIRLQQRRGGRRKNLHPF